MAPLLFDEPSHTYTVGGIVVPSVTQIIAPLYSFEGIPEAILNAKRDLGRAVHTACEYDDDGDLDEDTVSDQVRPYLEAYRAFRRDTGAEVVLNEQRLYNPKHRYAGTIDRRFLIARELWTVDLKTTASMSPAVGVQLAAYDRLVEEAGERADSKMGALQLKPDSSYKLHPFSSPADFPVFLSLLNVYNWRAKNAKR